MEAESLNFLYSEQDYLEEQNEKNLTAEKKIEEMPLDKILILKMTGDYLGLPAGLLLLLKERALEKTEQEMLRYKNAGWFYRKFKQWRYEKLEKNLQTLQPPIEELSCDFDEANKKYKVAMKSKNVYGISQAFLGHNFENIIHLDLSGNSFETGNLNYLKKLLPNLLFINFANNNIKVLSSRDIATLLAEPMIIDLTNNPLQHDLIKRLLSEKKSKYIQAAKKYDEHAEEKKTASIVF